MAIRRNLGLVLGKMGKMTMLRIQLHGPVSVDAMAFAGPSDVDALRGLLAAGVEAAPDEHRPNFYTVRHSGRRYYFYISPVSAKVWLLEALATNGAAAGALAVAGTA
jgi:hypothetical protein